MDDKCTNCSNEGKREMKPSIKSLNEVLVVSAIVKGFNCPTVPSVVMPQTRQVETEQSIQMFTNFDSLKTDTCLLF